MRFFSMYFQKRNVGCVCVFMRKSLFENSHGLKIRVEPLFVFSMHELLHIQP